MNGYERIITLMREQGAKYNGKPLQIGEMISKTTCKVGDIKLAKDDYLIAKHLTDYEIEVDITDQGEINAPTTTVSTHSHEVKKLTTKKSKVKVYGHLEKGDLVLVQRMSDEQYIIIERLVEL